MFEKKKLLFNKAMFFVRSLPAILSLPRVKINLGGREECFDIYKLYTKRHPIYKLIPFRGVGVALIPLPETFEVYLSGKHRKKVRKNRNRAIKAGYSFVKIRPLKHIDEILMINTSMISRQNKPMSDQYLSIEELRKYFKDYPEVYGIYDNGGILKAYLASSLFNEVCIIDRLLGHGEFLKEGIMYFIISELVNEMINKKKVDGRPIWLMYGTYFGCTPGLRYFKECLGFLTYKVNWTCTVKEQLQ